MTNSFNGDEAPLARDLAQALWTGAPAVNGWPVEEVLHLSARNDLLYAAGQCLDLPRPFPDPFEAWMQKAESNARGTAQLLSHILPLFREAGLPLLTMKTFLPFPYVDNNLDFFVVPPHRARAYTQVLLEDGWEWFRNLADVREPLKRTYLPANGSEFPAMHLHRAVSWNGLRCLDLEEVWHAARETDAGGLTVLIPSATHEVLIMLAHALFENHYITLHELVHLAHLCGSGEVAWDTVRETAAGFGWQEGMTAMLHLVHRLAVVCGFRMELPEDVGLAEAGTPFTFPYPLPGGMIRRAGMQKLSHDLRAGRVNLLPRHLFNLCFVGPVWMRRKVNRKCGGRI